MWEQVWCSGHSEEASDPRCQDKVASRSTRLSLALGSEASSWVCPEPSGRAMVSIPNMTDCKAP